MAFSSIPNRPTARRPRKSHSQPTLWLIATVSFGLGSAVSTLLVWQLHKLYRATVAPVIVIEGKIQAQYGKQDQNKLSLEPDGYFIASEGLGRVYLTGQPLNSYLNLTVRAQGSVSGICGPKVIPCYPLIEVRELIIPETPKEDTQAETTDEISAAP
jgi:hypothetical protein